MKKHGVWSHATDEEKAIQAELGEVLNQVILITKQLTNLMNQAAGIEQRASSLGFRISSSGFDLAEKVRKRHEHCE